MKKSWTRLLFVFLALIIFICAIPGAYALQPATPTDLGPVESAPDSSADGHEDAAPAEPEKPAADLELKIGVEAVFTLQPGQAYTIRIPSKDGKMQIDAESEYALKVEIKDETSGKSKVDQGEDNKPFRTFFGGHADRTYLLTVSFLNPQATGQVRLTVTKFVQTPAETKPAEVKVTEKPAEPKATPKPTEVKATEKPAEVKATAKPTETPAEKEEEFVEYNESVQTPVKLPANLLPVIFDESDLLNGVAANATAAPKPSVGYYPTLSKPVVYISWTDTLVNLAKADSYRLQRRVDIGSWKTVATRKASSYKPAGSNKGRYEYYDYKFSKGHVYTYRVQVIKSGKVKATSALSRVSTLQMSKITVSRTAKNLPTVKWTRVSNATGYYVFRRLSTQSSYSSTPYKMLSGSTVSFTDSKVTAGKTYYYLVVPFRKVAQVRYAGTYRNEVGFYAGVNKPEITSVSQNNAGATIKWKAVTGATKYQVYIKKAGSSSWALAGTVKGQKTTSFTHKKAVTPGTSGKYDQYKVRAVGNVGSKTNVNSAFSAVKKVYRLASPGTVKLSKSSTEDRVNVTWSKVNGAEKYYVYYKMASASSYSKKEVSGSKTSSVIPVTGTQKHQVYVVAQGKGTKSQRTAVQSITPTWYYVLLIGQHDYRDGCSDLPGSKYDAAGMSTLFKRQTNHVVLKYNLTVSGMKSAISNAFGKAGPNSICVFMYSGHGVTGYNAGTTGSLCGVDGSTISPAQLKSYMDSHVKSKHVVILLSSCGSGAFIQPNGSTSAGGSASAFNNAVINAFSSSVSSNAAEFANSKKYTVITAAKPHQLGWCVWWSNNGYTYTMRYLSAAGGYEYCNDQGRKTGWVSKRGDKNGDGKVTVKEAYQYAKTPVKQYGKSDMQFWSSEPGLILFQ